MTESHRPSPLSAAHAALIAASGISDGVRKARGYRTVTVQAELGRLGFARSQQNVPALLIPVHTVHGELGTYQARPDRPRVVDGRPLKYETPRGSRLVLDVPPAARDRLGDPAVPLHISEGARKADAAVSAGLCCIAVLGVFGWRGRNAAAGLTALGDWEAIALNGRRVYLDFDSDVMEKPTVHVALARCRDFLRSRHADVRVIYLPPGPGGAKVGLDDYLAAPHTVEELMGLATGELRAVAGSESEPAHPYRVHNGGLARRVVKDAGGAPREDLVPLTNFEARIVADVVRDDGAAGESGHSRRFEIELAQGSRRVRGAVPVAAFGRMDWPLDLLGSSAIVAAGVGGRDHARAAIQYLSPDVERRTVYTHTGWRHVDGRWVYLHAAGALGADGPVAGVEVDLQPGLQPFELPAPPSGERRAAAVRAQLALADAGPDAVTIPILGSIPRAILGDADFGEHLTGGTGALKTSLAACVQAAFGAGFDDRHVPADWSSTENFLEELEFLGKDAVLLVDDFAPTGSTRDVEQLHRKAERLGRAQGNRAGRGRMRRDGGLSAMRPPRGLTLSTGEDVPAGQSLRARLLILDVAKGDIRSAELATAQRAGADGTFAAATAAFVQSLAPQLDAVRDRFRGAVAARRRGGDAPEGTAAGAHLRTGAILAQLTEAWSIWLDFAVDVAALSPAEADGWRRRVAEALELAAAAQAQYQHGAEPAARFLELTRAAITNGTAHVAGPTGTQPADAPEAWGWRRDPQGSEAVPTWLVPPGSRRIGWVDGEDLYLEPDAAYAAARPMGGQGPGGLAVGARTLWRALRDGGYLRGVDVTRTRLTVRRSLEGVTERAVLHLSPTSLSARAVPEMTVRTVRTVRSSGESATRALDAVPSGPSSAGQCGPLNSSNRPVELSGSVGGPDVPDSLLYGEVSGESRSRGTAPSSRVDRWVPPSDSSDGSGDHYARSTGATHTLATSVLAPLSNEAAEESVRAAVRGADAEDQLGALGRQFADTIGRLPPAAQHRLRAAFAARRDRLRRDRASAAEREGHP